MTWNFCPWCGHRVYQHGNRGCIHVDDVLKECTDPDCQPTDVLVTKGGTHGHVVPQRCDCTVVHSQLVET